MASDTVLQPKHFYLIIATCALIILCESLQVMVKVKIIDHYDYWRQQIGQLQGDTFQIYLTIQLSYFFMKIITPMIFGLHTYLAFIKIRIGKLYVFIWTVLMLGSMAYTLVEWTVYSPFYYIKLISYFVGILTLGNVLKGGE